MNPLIYDMSDGIRIEVPFENGFGINIYLTDESAQEMINIIQNKLNARF
jgi:hypothetical protein